MTSSQKFYPTSLPLVRWWWFSGKIDKDIIKYQLNWLKENNFGGVEIAFVYPLPETEAGPEFLSLEWSDIIAFTKKCADELLLHCDFTFGTLWPFCGSFIPDEDSSKTWQGLSKQRVIHTWELAHHPEPVKVLDHLDKNALRRYSQKVGNALHEALKGRKSAIFCDSWEVETVGLWAKDFDKKFAERYGYDILPFMSKIADLDKNLIDDEEKSELTDVRYDYRKLISDLVINEFYKPFTGIAREMNSFTRIQCHGAPCDVLAAYSAADVPESEAVLFDPEFSVIAASAAALTGKVDVSCETFTCLYGWVPRPGPAPHIREELVSDLKLLSDALFANGVNQVLWHGMPYNPPKGKNEFYATVHVGESGSLAKHFAGFNLYMKKISGLMKEGHSFGQAAVYLPLEDMWMAGMLPDELRKPSAFHHWELHYARTPEKLSGYRPLWVSDLFLKDAKVKSNRLCIGDQEFYFLYINSDFIDIEALKHILSLAKQGLTVFFEKHFNEPGKKKHEDFNRLSDELFSLPCVSDEPYGNYPFKPFVEGHDLPEFWCRKLDDSYIFFFAHPHSRNLTYPLEYGYSLKSNKTYRDVIFITPFGFFKYRLLFEPNQSVMLTISRDGIKEIDIGYYPEE